MADSPPRPLAPRLVRACRNEKLDRPPVWLMRQAGRYMAEYQAVRGEVTFLELCKTPDLAAEVSMQPFRAFGMDAVIVFSDILTIPEAMGLPLTFTDHGPVFPEPLRHVDQLTSLKQPDPTRDLDFIMATLSQLRTRLSDHPDTALIGFSGAPWTLATYMIEGGTSRNFTRIKQWAYDQPEALHRLMARLSDTIALYLNAQIDAGAQVVQLFDTWAGILPEAMYREFVLPYHQQILAQLNRKDAPAVLFVNNSRGLLPVIAEARPDVISIDATTCLSDARQLTGGLPLQGNLDANALFAQPTVLKTLVEDTLRQGGNQGYVFNLGHGVLPQTSVENVRLLVDTVKASAKSFANASAATAAEPACTT
ncbi:MAG: uroporphyrinogen decarboxylase [Candidatus Melainabacteria bacterium]